jgi:DNA-binding MarR family transcriptional regulator
MRDRKRASGDFAVPEMVAAETGAYVPEQQAYLNLIRTAEVLSGELQELLSRHELSGKQYNVLRAIRRGGENGLTASQIGAQMTDPRADVTRLLDRLVRAGLVERRHDRGDRRIVRASLTQAGAELLQGLDAPLIALHRQQLSHLSRRDIETLIKLLKRAQQREK